MAYSDKVVEHFNNPRNMGSFKKDEDGVGTGIVGAPECGDVMKLQIKVQGEKIVDAKFKTFGHCQLELGHRMDEGQDARGSRQDQEHGYRAGAESATGQDPLLGAGGGRDQGRPG